RRPSQGSFDRYREVYAARGHVLWTPSWNGLSFELAADMQMRLSAQDRLWICPPRSREASARVMLVRTAELFHTEETSMIRKAKAVWRGTGRAGSGNLSTDSGVLANTPYSFKTRFENEKGTNPEELIAAAHAGCFTMALAFAMQAAGFTPT